MLMTFTVRARVDVDPSSAHLSEARVAGSVSEALRLALGAGEAAGFCHELDADVAIEILDVTHGQSALEEAELRRAVVAVAQDVAEEGA